MPWATVGAMLVSAAASYMAAQNQGGSSSTKTNVQSDPFDVKLPSGATIKVTKTIGEKTTESGTDPDAALWSAIAGAANTYTSSQMGKKNDYKIDTPTTTAGDITTTYDPNTFKLKYKP